MPVEKFVWRYKPVANFVKTIHQVPTYLQVLDEDWQRPQRKEMLHSEKAISLDATKISWKIFLNPLNLFTCFGELGSSQILTSRTFELECVRHIYVGGS